MKKRSGFSMMMRMEDNSVSVVCVFWRTELSLFSAMLTYVHVRSGAELGDQRPPVT